MKTVLFVMLGVLTLIYLTGWVLAARRAKGGPAAPPSGPLTSSLFGGLGFVINFFDTLGIGSFATTTAVFRLKRLVPDQLLPGTLYAGHTLPTVTQAFIYISIVAVDARTLVLMIASAVLGSWVGAARVTNWPRRTIQLAMGSALLVAAGLMLVAQLNLFPVGGSAQGVDGVKLAIAIVGNFVLGALMTVGVGLYAPCMILVSLLGMDPRAAFPIMMGSCAFLMPVGSLQFIQRERYDLKAASGLALGGIPAVLLAAFVVKSLPLWTVRWLVVVVVVGTATAMLRAGIKGTHPAVDEPTPLPLNAL